MCNCEAASDFIIGIILYRQLSRCTRPFFCCRGCPNESDTEIFVCGEEKVVSNLFFDLGKLIGHTYTYSKSVW